MGRGGWIFSAGSGRGFVIDLSLEMKETIFAGCGVDGMGDWGAVDSVRGFSCWVGKDVLQWPFLKARLGATTKES